MEAKPVAKPAPQPKKQEAAPAQEEVVEEEVVEEVVEEEIVEEEVVEAPAIEE